jgi:hypothetical protein
MARSVEEAARATREELAKAGIEAEERDLSYITQELLAAYEKAPAKRELDASQRGPKLTAPPYFYGNNLVHISQDTWAFTNSNSDDGYDSPHHKCGSGYRWQTRMPTLRREPCPGNNPPAGFEGWPPGAGP